MSVGLVIVSHSAKIAQGVLELAAQMAPDIAISAAGGTDEDGLGTSVAKIQAGIEAVDSGDGLVVLSDLGSAVMSAEMVVEMLEPDVASRIRIADAPLVEGGVAAAVAAAGGQNVDDVAAAAEGAAVLMAAGRKAAAVAGAAPVESASAAHSDSAHSAHVDSPSGALGDSSSGALSAGAATVESASSEGGPEVTGSWTLLNDLGLHARPAAEIAKKIQNLDVDAEINGVDAASIMLLMTLGLKKGQELTLRATGPDAQAAKDWLGAEIENGFGEL